jgi:hypothetical protein
MEGLSPMNSTLCDCNDTSNEDNAENSNEAMNDTKGWGEDGTL